MSYYQSKTVWITGASSGIGKALTKAFSQAGANLIISSRNSSKLEEVKKECQQPEKVHMLPLDLKENSLAGEWADQAWNLNGKVDILINNGGIGQFGSVLDTDLNIERRIFEVNYFGAVALTKAILPKMIKQGGGRIIGIGSIAGKFGQAKLAAYSASKAALILYYESLKEELIDTAVKVQIVSPGFINTNVTLNSLDSSGQPLNRNSPAQEHGMTTTSFAKRFLKVPKSNKFHTYIGKKELLAVPFHAMAPRLFYKLLRKSK